MVRLAVLLLVVIDVVCKEECAGLDGALSFTYYGKRNPYPGSTSTYHLCTKRRISLIRFLEHSGKGIMK